MEILKATDIETEFYGAPWIGFFATRLGWTEFSHDKELSKYWRHVGLNYTSVIGKRHAWCAMIEEAAMRSIGLKGSGSARAASYRAWGEPALDYWFGCPISIQHPSKSNHITNFLYWVDKKRKIAACIGGNQGNAISIAKYNLSGNKNGHDEVMGGPRWPKYWPRGKVIEPERALLLVKNAKVVEGGSTT